nr:cyclin-A2-2-like isoform X1 [Ipomoea batatas]
MGKPFTRAKSKRGASDESKQTSGATSGQPKKRAALKECLKYFTQSTLTQQSECDAIKQCAIPRSYAYAQEYLNDCYTTEYINRRFLKNIGLVPDTLYLTVNLIDRFLSENYIEKQKLQTAWCDMHANCLVTSFLACTTMHACKTGVTSLYLLPVSLNVSFFSFSCLFLASFLLIIEASMKKLCAPRAEEFCLITDNTYTKEQVVKMESCVSEPFWAFGFQFQPLRRFLSASLKAISEKYKQPKFKCVATLTSPNLLQSLFSESKKLGPFHPIRSSRQSCWVTATLVERNRQIICQRVTNMEGLKALHKFRRRKKPETPNPDLLQKISNIFSRRASKTHKQEEIKSTFTRSLIHNLPFTKQNHIVEQAVVELSRPVEISSINSTLEVPTSNSPAESFQQTSAT